MSPLGLITGTVGEALSEWSTFSIVSSATNFKMASGLFGILSSLVILSIFTTLTSYGLSNYDGKPSIQDCDTCSALLRHNKLHKWMKLDVILTHVGQSCQVYLKSSSWKLSRCSVNSCRLYFVLFLLLSGDLETNPGPVDDQMDFFDNINAFSCLFKKGLTIIHLNIRSVRNKIDIDLNRISKNQK